MQWVNGVKVCSHGFGLWLTFPDLDIDFDWGTNGEPDGFDKWWLWNFTQSNPSRHGNPTHADVSAWVNEAIAAGELYRPGEYGLYYSPNHRAKPRAATKVDPGESPIILVP